MWEQRNTESYYYRSVRVDADTVDKMYFGRGKVAEAAAEEDAQRHQQRRDDLQKANYWACLHAQPIRLADQLATSNKQIFSALLLKAGYKYQSYKWRPLNIEGSRNDRSKRITNKKA